MINQNGNITKEVKKSFGMSELTGYPRRVSEAILPVVEVNKKYCNVTASTKLVAPTTIYTTPTNKDFYIVSMWCQMGEAGNRTLTATINGQATIICRYATAYTEGTAVSGSTNINLSIPLKIDRGTNIIAGGNATEGSVGIVGYTEDITGD